MGLKSQNLIGQQLQKIRKERNLTQELVAARCGAMGWDMTSVILSKIETGLRCVTDEEVLMLALALRVEISTLYPNKEEYLKRKKLREVTKTWENS